MIHFAKVTAPQRPRSKESRWIATVYATLLVIMAVTQLFTFEEFMQHMELLGLPGGAPMTAFATAFLVTLEVFAVPFLLGMPLSKAFRWFSMIAGWLVAVFWLKLTLWIILLDVPVNTVGLLGTMVELIPGWWAVFIAVAFGLLTAWASWGLWPGKRNNK